MCVSVFSIAFYILSILLIPSENETFMLLIVYSIKLAAIQASGAAET
jgi:hypothetical protein